MQNLTELEPPFSYSLYPIIIVIILLIILTIYFFVAKRRKLKKLPEAKELNLKDLNIIKRKYLQKLQEVNNKLENNKLSNRGAYQNISSIVRAFVHEVTDIKVSNYTLKDIKTLNMPILYELVQEYYAPEFSENTLGDIKLSLEKTRKVIEQWN